MNPQPFPLVLGHEGAGVVESVGPGVTKMSKGKSIKETFFCVNFNLQTSANLFISISIDLFL